MFRAPPATAREGPVSPEGPGPCSATGGRRGWDGRLGPLSRGWLPRMPATASTSSLLIGSRSLGEPLDQVQLLAEPSGYEVVLAHAVVGGLAHPLGPVAVGQQALECPAEADQVAGVLQQQPAVA